MLNCQYDPLSRIINIEELPRRRACPPRRNLPVAARFCLDELANQRGDDVLRLRVEVITRTIQVRRQQVDCIEPILLAVRLPLNKQHFLR